MADEYIRRDAAMKAVASQYGACRSPAQNRMIDEIGNKIRRMPAADVAEVGHARWERVRSNWYCTGCNKGYRITKGAPMASSFSYCPNCGEKMDGGEDCYGNDSGD